MNERLVTRPKYSHAPVFQSTFYKLWFNPVLFVFPLGKSAQSFHVSSIKAEINVSLPTGLSWCTHSHPCRVVRVASGFGCSCSLHAPWTARPHYSVCCWHEPSASSLQKPQSSVPWLTALAVPGLSPEPLLPRRVTGKESALAL